VTRAPEAGVIHVLIVDDEPAMAQVLSENLSADGIHVTIASDGERGLELWRSLEPDLVVLDVMMPRLSGFEVCRRMRAAGSRTPVLFLSAKGQPEDRVTGLEVGGDDYLVKPFHLPEFMLRVTNMLRRQAWFTCDLGTDGTDRSMFQFGGHRVDFRAWTATLSNGRIETLGERELMILKLLVERANQVVSRDEILDVVWGMDTFPSSRTVDNFVVRLRKLFEPDPSRPVYFHTVWGVGYRFTPSGETVS
jgi:two-component system, OmpR family, alkaline phosphatase synthesis response regulator PhoP